MLQNNSINKIKDKDLFTTNNRDEPKTYLGLTNKRRTTEIIK